MGSVLRSWRRKSGCGVLLIALVFTALWVRSRNTVDLITINGTSSKCILVSGGERVLIVVGDKGVQNTSTNVSTKTVTVTLIAQKLYFAGMIQAEWRWWSASSVTVYPSINDENAKANAVRMVPFWYIILPLSLLSAWLLLIRPRPKQNPIDTAKN